VIDGTKRRRKRKAKRCGVIVCVLICFLCVLRFQTALGRRQEDDRDNLSLKRLDLAGPLLGGKNPLLLLLLVFFLLWIVCFAGLFRQLFKKLRNELKKQIKAALSGDKEFSVKQAVMKSSIITNGLSYW
jgi:H+/Cl- antiporter ClcA